MGGEKVCGKKRTKETLGSPPHGRGKDLNGPEYCRKQRITPAWAGKREKRKPYQKVHEDHPRMGGEKRMTD